MQNIIASLSDISLIPLKTALTPFAYFNDKLDCLYANIAFCKLFDVSSELVTDASSEFITADSPSKKYPTEYHFIAKEHAPNIFTLVPTLKSEGASEELFYTYLTEAKEKGFCQFNCFYEDKHGNVQHSVIIFHHVAHEGQDLFTCQVKEIMPIHEQEKATQEHEELQKIHVNAGDYFTQDIKLIKSIPLFAHAWDEELHTFDFGKACKMYQVMNDTMPICSFLFAPDYTMEDCNKEVERLFNTTKENFLQNFRDFLPAEQEDGTLSIEKARYVYKETMEKGDLRIEWTFINSEGEPLPVDLICYRINYREQDMLAAFAIDLRETKKQIKKIQEHVQEQRDRDKAILKSLPICVAYWNEKLEIIACNDALLKLFKVSDLKSYKENFKNFAPKTQASGVNSDDAIKYSIVKTFKEGYTRNEFERFDSEGNSLYVDVTAVRFEQGGRAFVAVYTVDLTAIKKYDIQLKETSERVQIMFDAFPIGATLWDENFTAIDCNFKIIDLVGYNSKEEYLQYAGTLKPHNLPQGKEYYKPFFGAIERVFKTGYETLEWNTKHKEGYEIPTELTAIRVKYHNKNAVVVYTRDIRTQKQMFKDIRDANARTQIMLNTFPMGANFWNKDLQIIDCNLEMVRLAGYDSKIEYLKHVSKQSIYNIPAGREYEHKVFETIKKAFVTGCEKIEWVTRHKNGYDIPVERTFIRVHNEKGEDSIIGYMRDLREQKKMLQELIDIQENLHITTELAERNANSKSEFLSHMSHELRTPINGIVGLVHLLLGSKLQGMQEVYAQKALKSTQHLLRIINDILDLSSFEKNELKMEKMAFSIDEVCSHAEDIFRQKAQAKNLNFTLSYGEESKEQLFGDVFRLKQAFFNLIGNAIKFTEKGAIDINVQLKECTETQRTFLFKVADTGIGITEEQAAKLFSAFSQAESFLTRKYGGTGLGLLLAKKIVEAMNGEIWVESEYGKFSTFSFYVTCDLFEKTDYSQQVAFDIAHDQYYLSKNDTEVAKSNVQKILIVEDNEINQLIMDELLQGYGYATVLAENGQVALDIIQQEHFDIILMDIQMPIMDGITATQEIRKQSKFDNLPIIAVTAHVMESDKELCFKCGMNDFVQKPISPPKLLAIIEKYCA